jgi:hypothetical protein
LRPEDAKEKINTRIDSAIEKKTTKILTFSVIINEGGVRGVEYSSKETLK